MAKTAHKPQMAAKEVPALSREQMIAEVRNLRAGKLFVSNMEFVDVLLAAYDEAIAELRCMRLRLDPDARRPEVAPFGTEG